ncbi:hydroxyacid dehydrogenase [Candidimonas sp. SYP-B2681]|uniref:hydroxyacid dehydrogenase n=1 Tax=Candidimonas sp. SYP-B2681 TaxID=2497686 RepID=UPI000F87DCC7|nr:hydroxyacid dehydrogenase [Candidimonas sp. SYP-B2681]RTZ40072.1 hydroxyacid dehydrogenase [Candidimonas sp. SYP-B2681]
MPYTIFVTARTLSPEGMFLLENEGCNVVFLKGNADSAEVEEILGSENIDAVISRTTTLSARAIASCSTLKVVSKHGVGVSNIDVQACTDRGIPVFVTPGANAQSVAEMTLGLMLATARNIPYMDSEIRAGRWSRLQNGLELKGRTVGLVGYGQVGRLVASFCNALGMQVLVYDPYANAGQMQKDVRLLTDLDTMLRRSDILSLHIPLTAETHALIGAKQLALLPDGAILINTARGEVIDEPALIEALVSRKLAAVGLDTMAEEPLAASSALRSMNNVVLTPHVGGSTSAALSAMAVAAVNNILAYLKNGTLPLDKVINISGLHQ